MNHALAVGGPFGLAREETAEAFHPGVVTLYRPAAGLLSDLLFDSLFAACADAGDEAECLCDPAHLFKVVALV